MIYPGSKRDAPRDEKLGRGVMEATDTRLIGGISMLRIGLAGVTTAIVAGILAIPVWAQQAAPPPFATTKVTDNVYIFRYGNHQAMFVVTSDGVIATDPISLRRPAKAYIDAIQAVTKAPIKYVIYSHR